MCPVLPRGSCRDRDVIHHRGRSVTFHRDRDNKTEMAFDIGVALVLLSFCIPLEGKGQPEGESFRFFLFNSMRASGHRYGG